MKTGLINKHVSLRKKIVEAWSIFLLLNILFSFLFVAVPSEVIFYLVYFLSHFVITYLLLEPDHYKQKIL